MSYNLSGIVWVMTGEKQNMVNFFTEKKGVVILNTGPMSGLTVGHSCYIVIQLHT